MTARNAFTYSGTRGRLLGHRFRSMPNGKSVGGKFHNHRKQSAVSAVFAMICHVHHVPLMNMFLELGVFRTVADEDGQISLPADLETIAEKLGLQTEMR